MEGVEVSITWELLARGIDYGWDAARQAARFGSPIEHEHVARDEMERDIFQVGFEMGVMRYQSNRWQDGTSMVKGN